MLKNKHSFLSWSLFGIGLGLILIMQISAIKIIYPYWGWNKSFFANYLFWPLLTLAIVCCSVAPLFIQRVLWQRVCFSVLGGLSAVGFYFILSFLIILLYGM
jgi:hypothetical protein